MESVAEKHVASDHLSFTRGETPNCWPGFMHVPPHSSCISFFLHFHFLLSLQLWMQPASLPCYHAAQMKIRAEAPIVSSPLCRHICLHHFNGSTDSPTNTFQLHSASVTLTHLLCVPPAKPKSHRQALV